VRIPSSSSLLGTSTRLPRGAGIDGPAFREQRNEQFTDPDQDARGSASMVRRHCSSHCLQNSAQTRQCSCLPACRLHSAPQVAQARAQTSSCVRSSSRSGSKDRETIRAVAAQRSAQSRLSRMQRRNSATIASPRHASAQAVQASSQATHASTHAARPLASLFGRFGVFEIICSRFCMASSSARRELRSRGFRGARRAPRSAAVGGHGRRANCDMR